MEPFSCEKPSSVVDNNRSLNVDLSEPIFTCDLCGQNGLDDNELRSHMLIEHVESGISCPFCSLEGTTAEEMQQHIDSVHTETSSQPSKSTYSQITNLISSNPTSNSSLPAPVHSNLSSSSILSGSLSSYAESKSISTDSSSTLCLTNVDHFQCPFCNWCTDSEDHISSHVNRQHLDSLTSSKDKQVLLRPHTNSSHNCLQCDLSFSDSTKLNFHVVSNHSDAVGTETSVKESSTPFPICPPDLSCLDKNSRHTNQQYTSDNLKREDLSNDALSLLKIEQEELKLRKEEEEKSFKMLQKKYGQQNGVGLIKQVNVNLEKAAGRKQMSISEFYSKKCDALMSNDNGVDSGESSTGGLIDALRSYYSTKKNSNVVQFWLSTNVTHYSASFGDRGWGCGYRNFQMVLSSLAHNTLYQKVLFNGSTLIPSITKMQRLIEVAWQKGFDQQGCEQLNGKLVGTNKWIGATEIVATLSSLKVGCQLLDFHSPTTKEGTHPSLFSWVKKNLSSQSSEFCPPLYLQHQGHSRTIIGVELLRDSSLRLLIFDPSTSRQKMRSFLTGNVTENTMRLIRRPLNSLKAKQYQIVAVTGILDESKYQESKVLKSTRVN